MRKFKRALFGAAAGGCLLVSGCGMGTFGPQAAGRVAMYTGLLGGVVTETTNTLVNLNPLAEAAAILSNQPVQNWFCQFTTNCQGAASSNNSGF